MSLTHHDIEALQIDSNIQKQRAAIAAAEAEMAQLQARRSLLSPAGFAQAGVAAVTPARSSMPWGWILFFVGLALAVAAYAPR